MKVWVAIILFLIFHSDWGQATGCKFYHLNHKNGLSQSSVNCILKDSSGYFWFGTDDGLNRWDGYSVKVFRHIESDHSSIGKGKVNALCKGTKGNIWIATSQGGMCKYIPELNSFKSYPILSSGTEENRVNNVVDIVPYKENLLVATYSGEIYMFFSRTRDYFKVFLFDEKIEKIKDIAVNSFSKDTKGNIWIGSSAGAFKVKQESFKGRKVLLNVEVYLPQENVTKVYADSKGNVWYGTHSGAYCKNETQPLKHYFLGEKDGTRLNSDLVSDICEDSYGNIWLGTEGGGINRYLVKEQRFEYYQPRIGDDYALASDIVNVIYSDDHGNLWIGTRDGGISYTNFYKQQFNHTKGYGRTGELGNNSVLSFLETPGGDIWIGTEEGINVFKRKKGDFNCVTGKALYMENAAVTAQVYDGRNHIYIGTRNKGLYMYDLGTGRFQNFSLPCTENSLRSNCISALAIGKKGEIWLGTMHSGVFWFDPIGKTLKNFVLDSGMQFLTRPPSVSDLMVDTDNKLWVGTVCDGLYKLENIKTGTFTKISGRDESKLSSNEIKDIYQDSKDRIWVGTHHGGISLLDVENELFKTFSNDCGLSGNTVQSIQEDQEGNLWLTTNRGITRLEETGGEMLFVNYDASEGLQGSGFNQHASMKTSDGLLFFGGVNGFNFFNPLNLIDSVVPGPVVISSLLIVKRGEENEESRIIKERNIPNNGLVTISHNHSTIILEYVMLDYLVPGENKYKYRLLPFDETWIEAGKKRFATYTNLKPGRYTFQVQGYSGRGVQSKECASVKIIVLPPIWKTGWFRGLMILSVILLLVIAYKIRMHAFEVQKEVLKELVGERTKELLSLNDVLKERNKEIYSQSEELRTRQLKLIEANKRLEQSNEKVEHQKEELQEHRTNLEKLIRVRTADLEKAKVKAEESEKLKMAFLSNMSHEIRTPMNAIVGFASLLADEHLTTEDKNEYIRQVNQNSEALLLLIDDILDLSKMEANQLCVNKVLFEVHKFIYEVYVNWQHLKTQEGLSVKFEFESFLPKEDIYLKSDIQRIRQVLNNLLDNAFKFTHKGKVVLGCKVEEEAVVLWVRDTGIGISLEDQKYIFDRFRKGEESKKKLYRGAGLGLTISRKLTELIGGEIKVESEHGEGATFYLTVPIHKSDVVVFQEKLGGKNTNHSVNLRGINILVAEDEYANFSYLDGLLSRQGAVVDHARDGEEAVNMASLKDYKFILMDIKMPRMSGIEATRRIKRMFPWQIVIAQTAYARPEEEKEFRNKGFDDFIAKPIKKNILFDLLRSFIN